MVSGGDRVVVALHAQKRSEEGLVVAARTHLVMLPQGGRQEPRVHQHKVVGVLTRSGKYLEVSGEHVIRKVT